MAFAIVAFGAAIELGADAARLAVAAAALLMTLPVAVHLVLRATHRTMSVPMETDEFRALEERDEGDHCR